MNRKIRRPPPQPPRGNERYPERDRKKGVPAFSQPAQPWLLPNRIVNILLGIVLFPFAGITGAAFFSTLAQATVEQAGWKTAPIFFFSLGLAIRTVWFFTGFRPRKPYVFAHEFTHAMFVILSGGRIHDFKFHEHGGHVIANKNNLVIALSPYFVPFWSMSIGASYGLIGLAFDLSKTYRLLWGLIDFRWDWLLFLFLGFSWAAHACYTGWMIAKDQPDLHQNGTFFSLTVIVLGNLLLMTVLLVSAAPDLSWGAFLDNWVAHLRGVWHWFGRFA